MKRYMVWWGALFFLVMFTSLYLMLETVTSQSGGLAKTQAMEGIEATIHRMEKDLEKNQHLIVEIKKWVGLLAKGDDKALSHLIELVNKNSGEVNEGVKHMVIQEPGQRPQEEEPKGRKEGGEVKVADVYEVPPVSKVTVTGDMCSLTDHQDSQADINMRQVLDELPFDNPDGGVWKQGWDVKYDVQQWSSKKLKIFVVPHSHCDPGWIKTYHDYFEQQTRHIFENMVPKLELDARRKFIFAEMSFFSTWWDQLDTAMRDRVKKLVGKGQLEIVTGGWVMTDEANTHYFAMIDQLLEGHQWLNGTLGVRPKSGWSIDPFGYSSTMAYILKRTGFEHMLIQRVHYSIKKHLARQRNLEFMWRQQWDQEHTTDMFCHMMPFYSYDVPHTCGPDPKVCCQFDFRRLPGSRHNCPWRVPPVPINDNNVAERAAMLLDQYRKKAQLYKTNVVLAPLGDDFRYDKADEWDLQYGNYQKLFDYINTHPELGAQGQFGTLSDYFSAVDEETKQSPSLLSSLSGDFFTYADRDNHYWSGYFTSRPFHKHLDRVLEASLRSAEILFTIAQGYARKNTASNFPSVELMKKLVIARRSLGLFQHHDGITGTAKDFVVNDYGKRMLAGLTGTKQVMAESAAFLATTNKALYTYDTNAPILNLDEMRDAHDSLPYRPVVQVSQEGRPVVLYNSLAHRRTQLVWVRTSVPHVQVQDPQGKVVHSQTEPYLEESSGSGAEFKVWFVAEVPALGLAVYTLRVSQPGVESHNHLSSITLINSQNTLQQFGNMFSVRSETSSNDFSIKNSVLEATFSGDSGLLKGVKTLATGMFHRMDVQFVLYGTVTKKDKSGAYLFLPDGNGQVIANHKSAIRIMRGPLVSEVHVTVQHVRHVVRLLNTAGVEGQSLDIHNIVDIRSLSNREISMRINTDVANNDRVFYTDLNGFQMQRRQTLDKLPLQANVYPMPAAMFIQDSQKRFSILSAQALGVFVMKPGQVDIMLDRRLNQDDGRGLEQGVLDNRVTPNHFSILVELPQSALRDASPNVAHPSLLAQLASLYLTQHVYAMPHNSAHTLASPLASLVSPTGADLPCEVHLLNLRTMQNKDDNANLKYIPRDSAALLLHHVGSDCRFPLYGATCRPGDGKVTLSEMFRELKMNNVHETSLTLMHDLEAVASSTTYTVPPMEIKTFRISLS